MAVLLMASLQVASVASIMPFLSVASDPSIIQENEYLRWAYATFGFDDDRSFLIALGLGALLALVVSNVFIILTRWAMERYSWGRNHSLSRRLLRSYLYRPYEYFLTRNSSELGKNILEEVKEVTDQMLKPTLRGVAKAVVALFIVGFLVYFDPVVALMVTVVLGAAYGAIYLVVRSQLDERGEARVEANTKRYQFVGEAFGGIKEVKIQGKEEAFLNLYDDPSERYARNQALYRVIKKAPRYIIEMVAFGGIILIAVYLIAVRESLQQVIPVLGLYAFAGYRLLPALQEAFHGLASARFNIAALNKLHRDLKGLAEARSSASGGADGTAAPPLLLEEELALREVSYTYPDADRPAIKNLSLAIPARSMVGFVGKTGSGKTTAVDLALGLLRPQEGEITIDGTPLRANNLRRWQQTLGYVPQHIYLSDDTVARNIAFGVPRDQIDMETVREAARRAHILDYVEQDLPNRWETVVGERGVKLSGGQRQRIGIARALYHDPSVLVFDEATSALDQSTEAGVMEAIYDLEGEQTILIISHRLSTVQRADNIFMLEEGRKVGEGSYDELLDKHAKFRSMALS
ncbi:ABC transporter ATP-binding protein [Salinibacter ruber]|uniref:ABC transporter ATP-binding protein n=1 Tax=Salinibacter ruber TaxID=146919 RepID=UPI002073EDAC|nr:ABC transporter ATP-binding protein [Salinibacter ruber]MCS4058846.1 ATP-binding cassette subfamily C protein [Salinibacter ruber]MCS4099555.1 ATP-binding cassette subfamily C protein [Salinibacter ruber]MCS4101716.1 ATP-binding cassette subfamily C protein [Salinibacter ruber]MCS4159645.1 ATP-binding cassette subfamily C protein [Salinibacter ruber]